MLLEGLGGGWSGVLPPGRRAPASDGEGLPPIRSHNLKRGGAVIGAEHVGARNSTKLIWAD